MQLIIAEASTDADRALGFEIRRQVFVLEQGVGAALEFDGQDAEATHLLASSDGRPLGTLRVRFLEDDRTAKIERVAVLAEARGHAIGRKLITRALALAAARGAKDARLHAQTRAAGFYRGLGFAASGPVFIEDGIPHVAMNRSITEGVSAS